MFSRIRSKLRGVHRNDSGAILLLSLASLLIIMMLAWVIIDAGKSARDKVELQSAADTSAYSHASVKSRSMNMIAYTNVAKRSITGILSMYQGMWVGYVAYVVFLNSKCNPPWTPVACAIAWANNALFFAELVDWNEFLSTDYHRNDVQAIDNYQQYMMWLTPWWAYSEAMVRGMRNGATTVASFPPPMGGISGISGVLDPIKNALPSSFTSTAGVYDRYPLTRMSWGIYVAPGVSIGKDSLAENMNSDIAYLAEHIANSLHHKNRSENNFLLKAGSWPAYSLGLGLFGAGYYTVTRFLLGDEARPYKFRRMSQDAWLSETSSLVFAYGVRSGKFDEERQKYNFIKKDYSHQLEGLDDFGYKAGGYWSLARSEMSYQEDELSPFFPSWTARLRPVALRGEWQGVGYDLNQAYHSVLPHLALTSVVASGGAIGSVAQDFVNMERMTRSFGHSTIEGIAK